MCSFALGEAHREDIVCGKFVRARELARFGGWHESAQNKLEIRRNLVTPLDRVVKDEQAKGRSLFVVIVA